MTNPAIAYLPQRDNKTLGGIVGNRQCSVSSHTMLTHYAGDFFGIDELKKITEEEYFQKVKDYCGSYDAIFSNVNHRNMMNDWFKKIGIPARLKHDENSESHIRKILTNEKHPLVCSILISKYLKSDKRETHYIVFADVSPKDGFIALDPFGYAPSFYSDRNGDHVAYEGEELKYMLSGGTGITYFDSATMEAK